MSPQAKFNWIVILTAALLIVAFLRLAVLYVPSGEEPLTPEQRAEDARDDANSLKRDMSGCYTP